VYRLALVLLTIFLFTYPVLTQQTAAQPKTSTYAAIPVEAAKQQNPVKPSTESVASARDGGRWTARCAMARPVTVKGDTAKEMKLSMMDFTEPRDPERPYQRRASTSSRTVTTICQPKARA
jgi:hypothetical protein